jgi:hypothetical protein
MVAVLLLHDAVGLFALVDIQRPAYQYHIRSYRRPNLTDNVFLGNGISIY